MKWQLLVAGLQKPWTKIVLNQWVADFVILTYSWRGILPGLGMAMALMTWDSELED